MNPEPKMQQYDVTTGWASVPYLFGDGAGDDAQLATLGFHPITTVGNDEYGVGIRIYNGPKDQFLVMLNIQDTFHWIMTPNLPSMIGLVNKLSPMVQASSTHSLREIVSDLNDLLAGEDGPLEDASRSRSARRRAERERQKD